jgi:hypothetical protein
LYFSFFVDGELFKKEILYAMDRTIFILSYILYPPFSYDYKSLLLQTSENKIKVVGL